MLSLGLKLSRKLIVMCLRGVAGAFMGGYCIFSPVFAELSTKYAPFKLMAIGLIAWVISAIMGATSLTYRKFSSQADIAMSAVLGRHSNSEHGCCQKMIPSHFRHTCRKFDGLVGALSPRSQIEKEH